MELTPGQRIKFGFLNGTRSLIATGLDLMSDPASAWTIEQTVTIFLGGSRRTDVHLEIDGFTAEHEALSRQGVFAFINGSFIGFGTIVGRHKLSFAVPGINLRPQANELRIALPNANSPFRLGIGTDERVLGIALVELSIS